MKRPEGFDERPDRPAVPSAAPAPDPVPRARRSTVLGRLRRRDDGLEARGTPPTSADVDEPRSDEPRSDDGHVDERRVDGHDAEETPQTTGLRRGRAGEVAGAAGRRVGASLTSGFASVAERLREYGAEDDHRTARTEDRDREPLAGTDDPGRGPVDDPDRESDQDDAAAGGERVAQVTDVLDWTRASRPDGDDPDDQRAGHADVPIGARVLAAETAREARVARRRRRLLERTEVRRFTRRSRHRRAAWTTAAALVLVLGVSILVAVFSPLMALRTIEVRGADRVDASVVRQALSDQMGTPLARLDFGRIKTDLAAFPLIESYVTEEAPPHTLVVTITERTPVVAVRSGSGYDLVDPAGIVVQEQPKAPEGLPVADVSAKQVGSSVFRTMTEVVLALPSTVRTQVAGVTATTADDVTLTMQDGSRVVWGSPDESTRKAALLAALVADHTARDPQTPVEYDVSAPENGIVRSQG